jgi:hypothetical protein
MATANRAMTLATPARLLAFIAFILGLLIALVGAVGVVAPGALVA